MRERLRRIFFIKTELKFLIKKSLWKNNYVNYKTSYLANILKQQQEIWKYNIGRHRILCPINSSFKIPSKKFRLSRFSLNNEIKLNKLPNLLKRGW